jgi:integration host factor subunit beta
MNKSELIAQIARKRAHLTKRDVSLAVNCILRRILDDLQTTDRIEIRGFGTFTLRFRPSRSRFNLKTGKKMIAPPYYAFHFKPAKELRLIINAKIDNAVTLSETSQPKSASKFSVKMPVKRLAKAL